LKPHFKMSIASGQLIMVVTMLAMTLTSLLIGAPPDLKAPGVMVTAKRDHTCNLASTGLGGLIYVDFAGKDGFSKDM
jgi:predicted RecA/RadA family phage recombinase